jgi:hypothetical protein
MRVGGMTTVVTERVRRHHTLIDGPRNRQQTEVDHVNERQSMEGLHGSADSSGHNA